MRKQLKSETTVAVKSSALMLRGCRIKEDANGLVCLADIHNVAGRPNNQAPADWMRLGITTKLIAEMVSQNMGQNHVKSKISCNTICYTVRGRNGGIFVHPVLALAYAEYLSPKLAIEVRQVYLRYKSADPSLADEVLQRSSPEANEWAAVRAMSRAKRNAYTDVLKDHGVTGRGYPICTDAIYGQVLGAPAKALKSKRSLGPKANLRDNLETTELAYVMAAEVLATDRIIDEDPTGNIPCAEASMRSARFIREAIERDKADRRKRLI